MTVVVVTGATGRVGRHVLDGLRAAGAGARALTRNPARAGDVRGDLADPGSLAAACRGADAAYLMWPFLTAEPAPAEGAAGVGRAAGPADAVVAAIARHVPRIVLLSSGSVDGRIPAAEPIARAHRAVEAAVERHAHEWTVLRPAGFAANSLDWAASIRADGVVRGAFPDAAGAWVHEADLAAVAVEALLGDGHQRRHHILTGPQVLTMAEQAGVIGAVTGHPVRWAARTPAQARADLVRAGWPAEFAGVAVNVQQQLARIRPTVTTTVAGILGREPRSYREWVADHAAAFTP